jgi:hypothetical protein
VGQPSIVLVQLAIFVIITPCQHEMKNQPGQAQSGSKVDRRLHLFRYVTIISLYRLASALAPARPLQVVSDQASNCRIAASVASRCAYAACNADANGLQTAINQILDPRTVAPRFDVGMHGVPSSGYQH